MVKRDTTESQTHIFGEVSHLIALAAFNALSRTRLGTLLGIMTLLFAVLAGIRIDALLGTVAGAMAFFLAVYALDCRLVALVLRLLLLAMLAERLA